LQCNCYEQEEIVTVHRFLGLGPEREEHEGSPEDVMEKVKDALGV